MPQIVCGTGTDGTVIRNVSDVFHDPFSYCPLAFHRRKHQHITLLLELTREKRQVFEKRTLSDSSYSSILHVYELIREVTNVPCAAAC